MCRAFEVRPFKWWYPPRESHSSMPSSPFRCPSPDDGSRGVVDGGGTGVEQVGCAAGGVCGMVQIRAGRRQSRRRGGGWGVYDCWEVVPRL